MLQRLPITLAQVKAGNTCEYLPNEICQNICSLCRGTETAKKLCNNVINSMQI